MSREIKFRAWSKESEKMVHPDENGYFHSAFIGENGYWQTVSLQRVLNNSNVDVMQYTGLKDAKGKEIYEGDIVKSLSGDIGEIIFNEGKYVRKINKDWSQDLTYTVEVIGNIYEHSHLLEESQNESK